MFIQDCDDAVEKLHKLNLNKIQEREIIHVTVHCCLHEKTFNQYYSLILQRFCHYDRRFQVKQNEIKEILIRFINNHLDFIAISCLGSI